MANNHPDRVLITGGWQLGGIDSFARGLRGGFLDCGIPVEVISVSQIFSRLHELRNPRILKLLSTTAVYSAPLARRAICIAHGIPCAAYQGWARMALIAASFRLAACCAGTQLVAVSEYTASHLEAIFNVPLDAVILNPVKSLYLDPNVDLSQDRVYITYLGRLAPAKGIGRLIPIIRDLLKEAPNLRMCIIGEGPEKTTLEKAACGDPRFQFLGNVDDERVREYLRRTKIFVSGNKVEGLGITYLEALSQGCVVVMPAGGGGIEIALDQIGTHVYLLPLSLDHGQSLAVLRKALESRPAPLSMSAYSAKAVASAYLDIDARFNAKGTYLRGT
jgi:glycosyltransferase involved in cell wall biosynthesis